MSKEEAYVVGRPPDPGGSSWTTRWSSGAVSTWCGSLRTWSGVLGPAGRLDGIAFVGRNPMVVTGVRYPARWPPRTRTAFRV